MPFNNFTSVPVEKLGELPQSPEGQTEAINIANNFEPVPVGKLGRFPQSPEGLAEAARIADKIAYLRLNCYGDEECHRYNLKAVLKVMAEGILHTTFTGEYAIGGNSLRAAAQSIQEQGFENVRIIEDEDRTLREQVDSFLIEQALNYLPVEYISDTEEAVQIRREIITTCYEFQREATIDRIMKELYSFNAEIRNLAESGAREYPYFFNQLVETLREANQEYSLMAPSGQKHLERDYERSFDHKEEMDNEGSPKKPKGFFEEEEDYESVFTDPDTITPSSQPERGSMSPLPSCSPSNFHASPVRMGSAALGNSATATRRR